MQLYLAIIFWVGLGISAFFPAIFLLWLGLNFLTYGCYMTWVCFACLQTPCCDLSHQHYAGTGQCTYQQVMRWSPTYSGGFSKTISCTAGQAEYATTRVDPFGTARTEYYRTEREPEYMVSPGGESTYPCRCAEGNYVPNASWNGQWHWIKFKFIKRLMSYLLYDTVILVAYIVLLIVFCFTSIDEHNSIIFSAFIGVGNFCVAIFFLVRLYYYLGCC